MAENTTETTTTSVEKASDGTVKISVEKYEELLRKANEQKVTYNQTIVERTAEQVAEGQVMWGNLLVVAGVVQVGVGFYLRLKGAKGLAAL